jgi:hypothetical protein
MMDEQTLKNIHAVRDAEWEQYRQFQVVLAKVNIQTSCLWDRLGLSASFDHLVTSKNACEKHLGLCSGS